jgi:hypothetical protein
MRGFVKLKAPDGFGSMSYNGRAIDADPADGSVWVLPSEVDDLKSHGFRDWADGSEEPEVEAMSHSQLVTEVMKRTLEVIKGLSADELRARLAAATPSNGTLPGEEDAPGSHLVVDEVKVEDIATMRRPDLFRFLKGKGFKLTAASKDVELREIALSVFEKKLAEVFVEDEAVVEAVATHVEPPFPFGEGA